MRKRIEKRPVNKISETYKIGLKKYEEVKKQKREDMISGQYFKCFFTNTTLDENGNEGWHHAIGRVGNLLYDYRNIFPVLDIPHREYHDLPIEKLIKTWWYPGFIKRIKAMNKRVYNKELDRFLKAKVISIESFINEYK